MQLKKVTKKRGAINYLNQTTKILSVIEKKQLLLIVVLTMVSFFLWPDLQVNYKKGKITLKENEQFGRQTDWENYFYNPFNNVVMSPDGSVFVVSGTQHCIYKFDKQGNMVKKFGQKGRGPGDMLSPTNPTILDSKYIVVGEYATNRRVDIWDLNGNFVKLVRTKNNNYGTTSLMKNKVAYFTFSQEQNKKNGFKRKYQVILKDTQNGIEKIIREITLLDVSKIRLGPGLSTVVSNFVGEVYMVQTIDGNLAVGVSNQPKITIYSPDGKVVHTFDLKISPIPVTDEYIKNFKSEIIKDKRKKLKEATDETSRWWYQQDLKVFPKYDFSKIFSSHLPLYYEILIDGDGNFLVFKMDKCLQNCETRFQVYSKSGKFICETVLGHGIYDINIDKRNKRLIFAKDGIYGYYMTKGDEEEIYRLFKSNY